ncbi:hypothetical protein BD413DRAFT_200246 [Trametes elegans]|nr:hypothetical protein BD413DRAFT_200246 [Trametes elegans]
MCVCLYATFLAIRHRVSAGRGHRILGVWFLELAGGLLGCCDGARNLGPHQFLSRAFWDRLSGPPSLFWPLPPLHASQGHAPITTGRLGLGLPPFASRALETYLVQSLCNAHLF